MKVVTSVLKGAAQLCKDWVDQANCQEYTLAQLADPAIREVEITSRRTLQLGYANHPDEKLY